MLSKKVSSTSDASRVLDEEASIAEAKRQEQEAERDTMPGLPATTCIGRIGRPLFRMINRPWKVRRACRPILPLRRVRLLGTDPR